MHRPGVVIAERGVKRVHQVGWGGGWVDGLGERLRLQMGSSSGDEQQVREDG